MTKKTLTIVLCETREAGSTLSSLERHVLMPMDSDLAFCGSDAPVTDPIIQASKFVWSRPEPAEWAETLDSWQANGGSWRQLVPLGPMFLGGAGVGDSVGSGAIIMYWREFLRISLPPDLIEAYEWFIVTRSDFLWQVPHPRWEYLNPDKIYLMNGEQYNGVSDRHIIFHREFADSLLRIAAPIFEDSAGLRGRLEVSGLRDINPERYILFRLEELGLAQHLQFIPYMGFTIRHHETATRWSSGKFNSDLGFYVKYPEELSETQTSQRLISRPEHWKSLLNNGLSARAAAYAALRKASRLKRRLMRRLGS
jgi:hypothetical protein